MSEQLNPHPAQEAARLIGETANYQGNWMELQLGRMVHPDFRNKFDQFIDRHAPALKEGEPASIFEKAEAFQGYYYQQKEDYDNTLETVYASVVYGPAKQVGGVKAAHNGHGALGKPATVYADAPSLQTGRQKDIIAAHEAYHGVVDATGSAFKEVNDGFDWTAFHDQVDAGTVAQPGYLRDPNELMARMSQLKNYFGMDGDQQFTAEHFDYARDHYVADTELDNSMTTMLAIVTPRTQDEFIALMNRLPV